MIATPASESRRRLSPRLSMPNAPTYGVEIERAIGGGESQVAVGRHPEGLRRGAEGRDCSQLSRMWLAIAGACAQEPRMLILSE